MKKRSHLSLCPGDAVMAFEDMVEFTNDGYVAVFDEGTVFLVMHDDPDEPCNDGWFQAMSNDGQRIILHENNIKLLARPR